MPFTALDANDFNLHSNMDRLKHCYEVRITRGLFDLHSNMDRLKLLDADLESYVQEIYIPIWID